MRSVKLFLAAMIVLIPFQISNLESTMAEEEAPNREAPKMRRLTKSTKRRRGGSGARATKDPLLQEVITVDSDDEAPRHHQVGLLELSACGVLIL